MNTTKLKSYINKYGNISHIIIININENIDEYQKNIILETIYDVINDKNIIKNLGNNYIEINWRVSNITDLFHYYTDVQGMYSDKCVYKCMKLLWNDIEEIIGTDKCSFLIVKPLTKEICVLSEDITI